MKTNAERQSDFRNRRNENTVKLERIEAYLQEVALVMGKRNITGYDVGKLIILRAIASKIDSPMYEVFENMEKEFDIIQRGESV